MALRLLATNSQATRHSKTENCMTLVCLHLIYTKPNMRMIQNASQLPYNLLFRKVYNEDTVSFISALDTHNLEPLQLPEPLAQ